MDLEKFQAAATEYLLRHERNHINSEEALSPELAGLQLYDAPLFAVAAAEDPLFWELKDADIVHPGHMLPTDWLADAKTVLSCFMPFSARVKASNTRDMLTPSDEWLHARIEGQEMVALFGAYLQEQLEKAGFAAVCPTVDSRFSMLTPLRSNWSERHIAFICGLGTFGLSRGIITEKGMAGRLVSVITDAPLTLTPRPYTDRYEYCSKCGQCAVNCPVAAIDRQKNADLAKDHEICEPFVFTKKKSKLHGDREKAYIGCGKCQVAVPCQDGIPPRAR